MLVFSQQQLVLLATPKTGSTALNMALKPLADVVFQKGRKHMNARRYQRRVRPFVEKTFGVELESVAIMREPLSQLSSWYRYRLDNAKALGMEGVDFEAFIKATMQKDPPEYAGVGSQLEFLRAGDGNVGVTHLFAYEKQTILRAFLEKRLEKELTIKVKNVSRAAPTPLSDETKAELREARKDEFALYDWLIEEGGHLKTPDA